MDALYAFPSLLLAIVVSIVLSGGNSGAFGGILAAAISITVVFVPQYYRVIRNATLSVKAEPYVDAAKVVGVRTPRILRKHIFSNVSSSLPVIGTLNASEAILTLAGLGFLGFGIEPSAAAEWGYDLNKALPDASSGIWWTGVFPGLAIVLIVLGATLVGESLNDILNPLLRTRGADTSEADQAEIEQEFAELTGRRAGPWRGRPRSEVTERRDPDDAKRVAALSLTDLAVTFRTDAGQVDAVNGISFDVAPGEVVAVVGESGSGKSVSSRAVLGLLPSTAEVSGSARLGDRELLGHVRTAAPPDPRRPGLDGLPGAGDGAQPGLHGRLADRRGPAGPPQDLEEGGPRARRRAARAGRHARSGASASTTTRTSSPAGRSSASSSRWRSPATPTSSSPTSRRRPSTSRCRPRSSSCCCRCATGSAPRSS